MGRSRGRQVRAVVSGRPDLAAEADLARDAGPGGDIVMSSVRKLATFTARVHTVVALGQLIDALTETVTGVLDVDSVHVGRVDRPGGRLEVLCNAGDLAAWQKSSPTDGPYLIDAFGRLASVVGQARPWRGSVQDGAIASSDRELLARLGRAHGLSVPMFCSGAVWGELFVTRSASVRFGQDEEDLAVVIAGIAAGGLERLVGDRGLRELAYTDSLTGLGNRRAGQDQLHAWAGDPVTAASLAVVLCDVNGLKSVNDTHGHLVGDRLIREVAEHVSAAARQLPDGVAARVGGDEFLIASPCPDHALLAGVVAQLVARTGHLTFGEGLSCGTAWAGALLQSEPTPQALVQSLLRIADAEQYRSKIHNRRGGDASKPATRRRPTRRVRRDPAPPGGRRTRWPSSAPDLDVQVSAGPGRPTQVRSWAGVTAGPTLRADRLANTGHIICQLAGAVSWWVSAVDHAEGTIRAISCGTVRHERVTDGLWPKVELDPRTYQLVDFPLTASTVRDGGVFYVDTRHGDPVEQQLLIQTGYQAMIASGGTDLDGRGWLIEIYGDSLTTTLQPFADLLDTATRAAIG